MTQGPIAVRSAAGEALSAPVSAVLAAAQTTTSLACYFQHGSSAPWQWGLNADNSYYKLNGFWLTTPYTKLMKFVTDTNAGELVAAANQAMAYYGLGGSSILAICAADSAAGYSYPIVSRGSELYPKY
jgi:hypothetical protein